MPERGRPHHRQRRARASFGGAVAAMAWSYAWRQMARRSRQHDAKAAAAVRESEHPPTAYEPTDWHLGVVWLVYLGALALLVISCLVLIAAYPSSVHDVSRALHFAPPDPQLQTNPGADLKKFRAKEEKQLDTYYWVDRRKGIVHIPIEDAMKKLVRTGIPGFPKAPQP